ncbi:hypothetical protein [Natronorarus salvus]|uniref:hypothetical protein n=1 Tax=Natronorarus salvus TaxID=3117733 RepID=UPI002F2688C5
MTAISTAERTDLLLGVLVEEYAELRDAEENAASAGALAFATDRLHEAREEVLAYERITDREESA